MNQVDYEHKVWDEDLATRIFYLILTGEVSYASGIAKKTDKNPQTIKNYINGLVSRDIVNQKEQIRGKIIYEASTEALAEDYYEVIKKEVQIRKDQRTDIDEEIKKEYEKVHDSLEDQRTRIEAISLIEDYLEELMNGYTFESLNVSLDHILKFEFSYSLNRLYFTKNEYFEKNKWLRDFYKAVIYSQLNGWSINILDDVIKERDID